MTATTSQNLSDELAERGWRTEIVTQPDGSIDYVKIPLTSEEFLHPQEGYHLPNSTFHDDAAGDTKDMLTRRYANDSTAGVFRDLIIQWGIPNLKNHCPDTFVVFGIQNKEQNHTEFVVSEEGVRPSLIIEVVSPRYRKEDRQTKVKHYPSSVTFRVFLIKGLKEKTLEGKQGMDVELQILKHLARDAHPTVAIVDEYCAEYKELFKEVRNYECFKYLHLGIISTIKGTLKESDKYKTKIELASEIITELMESGFNIELVL
ncbi:Uma2 family endonuclease, partial [Nostoc paludosum FACHB-159]